MGFDCPWLLGKTCVGYFRVSVVVDISHENLKSNPQSWFLQ